jgi:imidazoleglycerol-phosphate dehydratase/histidinol-phosphatase
MKKKVLFIDRDGTLILETDDFKIEKFEKLVFYPNVFQYMGRIARELDYELVMVTNQDGLGTEMFPEKDFWEVQHFIVQTFDNEGIHFEKVFIDKSFPEENLPTRKPGTGMLTEYFSDKYDLHNSLVIGDRITDVKLAKNLGCKCIWMNDGRGLGATDIKEGIDELRTFVATETRDWQKIYEYLKGLPK